MTADSLQSDDTKPSRAESLVQRFRTPAACAIGVAAFYYFGVVFHVPRLPGISASLFQDPSPLVELLVLAATYLAVYVVATIVGAGDGVGLLSASAGLIVLSARCGEAHDAIIGAGSPSGFARLALETGALGAIVGIALALPLSRIGRPDDGDAQPNSTEQGLLGFACATLLMFVLALLLVRSDAKFQAIGGIGVSACLAAYITRHVLGLHSVRWLVAAPVVVGIAGYLLTHFQGAEAWMIGQPRGMFAPLAHALPLDYVGAGVLGITVGFRTASPATTE